MKLMVACALDFRKNCGAWHDASGNKLRVDWRAL